MIPNGFISALRRILGPRAPKIVLPKQPVLPRVFPKACPPLDAALVAWIDWAIPQYDPRPGDDLPGLMYRAGQREVVNKLRAELARQQAKSKDL